MIRRLLFPVQPASSPASSSPVPHLSRLFIGLDLGQRADHSALALIQRAETPTGEFDHLHRRPVTRLSLHLRLIKHWPLGTPYLDIAAYTRGLLLHHAPKSALSLPILLALDASGPGAPLFELLRTARTGAHIQPVLITSGHQESRAKDSTQLIPRDLLLSQLRLLFERGALTIPHGIPRYAQLREELAALGQSASQRHDDLVIAVALAANAALHVTPSLRSAL